METNISRLPAASLIMSGAASLIFLSMTIVPLRPVVLVACVMALVGLVLGIADLIITRRSAFSSRMPAIVGIVLGGIVFLWAGLIFVFTTPF